MEAIATSSGMKSTVLLTKQATRAKALAALRSAAKTLKSDDLEVGRETTLHVGNSRMVCFVALVPGKHLRGALDGVVPLSKGRRLGGHRDRCRIAFTAQPFGAATVSHRSGRQLDTVRCRRRIGRVTSNGEQRSQWDACPGDAHAASWTCYEPYQAIR